MIRSTMMFGKRKSNTVDDPSKEESKRYQKNFNNLAAVDDDWFVLKPSKEDETKKAQAPEVTTASAALSKAKLSSGHMAELPDWLQELKNNLPGDATKLNDIYYLAKKNAKAIIIVLLLGVLATAVPRSKQAPISLPRTPHDIDYDEVVKNLQERVKELETINQRYEINLSSLLGERNNWRSLAVSCQGDLREVSKSLAELEEEVRQTKSLVPVTFGTQLTDRTCHSTHAVHNATDGIEMKATTCTRNAVVVAMSTAMAAA